MTLRNSDRPISSLFISLSIYQLNLSMQNKSLPAGINYLPATQLKLFGQSNTDILFIKGVKRMVAVYLFVVKS